MPVVEEVQVEINTPPSKSRQGSQLSMKEQINCSNSSVPEFGERNMTGGSNSPTGSTRSRSSRESPLPQREKINKDLFVYPLEKKYVCTHCEDLLYYPVQLTECGHRFCKRCVYELKTPGEDDVWRCGKCMIRIEGESWQFDTAFNNDILALTMKCKNYEWGCKWEGEFKNSQEHSERCDYSDIQCPHDCGAKFQRRFLQKHLDKDCPKMIISCPYCDDRHLREDKKEHLQDCPRLPLPCPNKCDKKLTLPRDELDEHIDKECPRTKLMCQYEAIGCSHRCSREKQPKHYKSELINHVKLIYDVMMKQKETLELHEVRLYGHDDSLKNQDKRIGDLEKIAHSQLIWRIEDYARKLKEAKAGNNDTLFSPTFTTSKHGYRLCASVCLNGDGKGKGTHMSVFISVLKGAYDALLKWPFDYRVTFFLLDQNEDPDKRKHIKFSIKPNPCPENEPFLGKPRLEKNASFGGAKFAKHEEIERRHYLLNDTIFLKITVDCDGLSEP